MKSICSWSCHLLLLFPLAFLLPVPAAQALPDASLQYTRRVWHVQDGLPEETVQAIQQTDDGSLWIGTTGGLTRFDGNRFVSFGRSNTPAFTDNSVFCLLAAHDRTLWVGTEGGGLLHFENGVFHRYSAAEGLTDGFVRSLVEDERGQLWIGTDNGLFRMTRGVIERVETSQFTTSLAVHSIYQDREHRIWVGGLRLLMFDGANVRQFRLRGAYSQNRVKTILQTSDGTIWVGTVGGVQRLGTHGFTLLAGISATVRSLRQTADGTLWIGTIGHGLYTYAGGKLHKASGAGLLPSNTVLSMVGDHSGQTWIGTQDGLVRLSKTPVGVVPLPGGFDPDFETISYDEQGPGSGDRNGTVWAVSSRVYAIRHDHALPYTFKAIAGIAVRNVYRDHQGTLWIGTDGSGAFHLAQGKAVHYSAPGGLANNFVRGFLEARDHSMWVATDEGVSRIAGGRVRNFGMRDGLAYFSTRSLLQDREGNVWIGTDQGLSTWNGTRLVTNAATRALREEKVWSILEDDEGSLWFGTRDHGIFRYRDGALLQFTTAQGLVSNSIYQLLEDRFHQLWVSSPNSIFSIPLDALNAGTPGNVQPVTIYSMPYDADDAQMYGGRQPSGCIGADGSLWFPSDRGAVHIVPEPAPRLQAPRLLVTRVAVDGSEVKPSDLHLLTADVSRLEIAFAPGSLQSQEETRFRYRLKPFDRNWTYAGSTRSATYTNLPAGRYHFEVVAFPLDNPSSTSEAVLDFRKQPHLYLTWWFLSLVAALLSLCSLASYRWRMRLLQLRFGAVLEERSRLAREMHDTVIQGCTSVSALLEAVSSLERENHSLRGELIQYARTQMRSTINEARDAVWNLRHRDRHGDEPQQDLFESTCLMAEHFARDFNTPVDCTTDGGSFPLPSSIAHELLMVIREALHNAVLHGMPTSIVIHFDFRAEELEVRIRDDGTGFCPGAAPSDGQSHYGIAGMEERIARLDGHIEWMSVMNQGTTVRFRLKRSSLFPPREKAEL
ncbi:sensor histidine kinase [Acidipila sp. EB88]|uniref:sensor histidine kinase n=1 Tax=Acidipila sp. EB88 TaxID=2305226 RepID=UPI0013156FBD|nr:sensor histidine kinase [Acidipila sp. EB88]